MGVDGNFSFPGDNFTAISFIYEIHLFLRRVSIEQMNDADVAACGHKLIFFLFGHIINLYRAIFLVFRRGEGNKTSLKLPEFKKIIKFKLS